MKKVFFSIAVGIVMLFATATTSAQGYLFTDIVKVPTTSVKNQGSSGTCWSYATAAFLESELLRTGKGDHDLSEMYAVRINYVGKMNDNYLRRGKGNLGQGSLAHMFTDIVKKHGMIPQEAYNGINYDSKINNHKELNKYINAFSQAAVELKQKGPQYDILTETILDTYLGKIPEKFTYKGKEYTPLTFAAEMGLNMNDYVEITSFTHIPFYEQSIVEVPDNWNNGRMWNVTLDEFIAIIENALTNGYTVCWDGDVSEKGFSHKNGVAINPAAENLEEALKFEKISKEISVDQIIRQGGYENFTTTDDHLMLLTGISKDQEGNKYFITKNSWGPDRNSMGGYLNMSESFVRAKSISVMVHKNSIPKEIRKKLNF